jgi:hypothetical protein
MAAEFGIRVTQCGPNRLEVFALVRQFVLLSPTKVKAAFDAGASVLLSDSLDYFQAEELSAQLRAMGAVAEVFVSSPCESKGGCGHEPPRAGG